MREIFLNKIHAENFKKFHDVTFNFGQLTNVFGKNYEGKSSINDMFSWVLFGKSATGNSEGKQFVPRRYDSEGVPIDRVDVLVELFLTVDNRPIMIRKIQKQNWVRKRGADTETYEGDTNEYYWNEVPVKETEHKKRVAEIINEEVFKMITNPYAFVAKKDDVKRKFLVEKVAKITDADVFSLDSSFSELEGMTENYTIDELVAINKKALQGYKDEKDDIEQRIKERSRDIVDTDFAEHELALSALKEQLSDIEEKISDTSKAYEGISKLKTEIADYKSKISEIERSENAKLSKDKAKLSSDIDNTAYQILRKSQQKKALDKDIELINEKISSSEIYLEVLRRNFTEEKTKEFDITKNICPTCGKEFDEDKKSELLKAFEEEKVRKMHDVNLSGAKVAKEITTNKSNLENLTKQLSDLTAEIEKLTADETAIKAEKGKLPEVVDLSGNKDYQDYKNTLSALEFSLKDTTETLKDTDELKMKLNAQKAEIQSRIDTVNRVLATKKVIEDAKDRVDELTMKLKQTTNDAAKCERVLDLIEKFDKAKMELLSERVNDKFKLVKWMLFRPQKNGGYENVCIPMIHGSPYGENTTSTTERLMAGLDIINTLQETYETKAPVWIDNAEAYNDFNIPEMDCQMILLKVASPVYEYKTDADGNPVLGTDGKPIIEKVLYDGSLKVEVEK